MATSKKNKTAAESKDEQYPLPIYDRKEDIYNQEEEIPLEDSGKTDQAGMKNQSRGLGSDLDIPGAELDDEDEAIGEEDEENNFYSLGGDNHDDMEEENTDLADEE